jgi:Leucine-rich repeat (LRR) protein
MTKIKNIFLIILLGLFSSIAQAQTIKGYTKEEIQEFTVKVEDQVRFLEFLLNTVGSSETPARDKDVVIRESYLKIFRDANVQVEDDLLLDRKVVTNKSVTAYLKDIEFFYKNISFKFKIREIKPGEKDNGDIFFLVSLDRTFDAIGNSKEKISNTKPRFIEINLDRKSQDLKIASIYTTKLSRDEELLEWWEILNPDWKIYFTKRFDLDPQDSIKIDQLYRFVEIDSLDISGLNLSDLSPLEALRNLKFVNLSNTKISKLGPISNVTFLEHLDISNTSTSDIQFIKYSDRLKYLDISNTQIEDISELANLKAIRSLKANKTPVMSFEVLNEFKNLETLSLVENGFNNAENIKELVKLEELDLSKNYLINPSALANLTALRFLNISQTNIEDLTPLQGLNQLQVIELTQTPISDLTPLHGKESIQKILADETRISVQDADKFIRANPKTLLIHHVKDLETWWSGLSVAWKESLKKANSQIKGDNPNVEILTYTIGLESLDLDSMGIDNLNPIVRFVKIKSINFSNNPIEDLIPLTEVKTLIEITGKNTKIRDISPLNDNQEIELLDLAGSPVESILDALVLEKLKKINVNGSSISLEEVPDFLIQRPDVLLIYRDEELNQWWEALGDDWKEVFRNTYKIGQKPNKEDLHRLTSIPSLKFTNLPISDLSPLTSFVNLRSLDIFDAQITDISPVRELIHLEKLRISQVAVLDFIPLGNLPKLHELDISNTGIEDLAALVGLNTLKILKISGTNLSSLKGIEVLSNLEELDVASTNLKSIKQLSELKNLIKLTCFNTRLSPRAVEQFKLKNPSCEVRFY